MLYLNLVEISPLGEEIWPKAAGSERGGRRHGGGGRGATSRNLLKSRRQFPRANPAETIFFSLFKKMVSAGFALGNCMRDFLGHSESLSEAF